MQAEKPRQHRVRMFAPPKMLSVGTPIYISVIFQCKLNLVNAREEMCVRHKGEVSILDTFLSAVRSVTSCREGRKRLAAQAAEPTAHKLHSFLSHREIQNKPGLPLMT